MREAIERADVVLSGGGGLLQNVTSLRSLLYYSGVIRSAVRAGKPTMVFAQSIGPLDFWGRAMVRKFCKGLAAATVRDERSRALLGALVPGVRVERTADPVFLFEPGGEPLDLAAEGLAGDDAPLVVVSARKWQGADATAQALAASRSTGWPASTARASRSCRSAVRPTPRSRPTIIRSARRPRCCCPTIRSAKRHR